MGYCWTLIRHRPPRDGGRCHICHRHLSVLLQYRAYCTYNGQMPLTITVANVPVQVQDKLHVLWVMLEGCLSLKSLASDTVKKCHFHLKFLQYIRLTQTGEVATHCTMHIPKAIPSVKRNLDICSPHRITQLTSCAITRMWLAGRATLGIFFDLMTVFDFHNFH